MSIAILIPARYASSRFPGKPLAPLKGATGMVKSLIQRSYEAAKAVERPVDIYVATDDDRIAQAAKAFGAATIMTAESCQNGTLRCQDALRNLPNTPDLIINLQGDAPLTPAWFVEALIDTMLADPSIPVATPVLRCDTQTLQLFQEDRKAGRVGGTTAVFDQTGNALYFSKEVIPYADALNLDTALPVFHHVGLYAYRPTALNQYANWPESTLERCEGLEQLRFLENGISVRCVQVEAKGRVFWELNNPIDTPRIESALVKMGLE